MRTSRILPFFVFALIVLLPASAQADPVGTAFTYQGRLVDNNQPANGSYDLKFRLYDSASGGNQMGGEISKSSTQVNDGYFTVEIDFNDANAFNGNARWLEIDVQPSGGGNFTTLSPRQKVTPTPYAIYASGAEPAFNTAKTSRADLNDVNVAGLIKSRNHLEVNATGTADNVIIQTAIDYLAAHGGGDVELLAGTYVLANSIVPRSGVWVHGASKSIWNPVNNCPDLYFDVNSQSGTIITGDVVAFVSDPNSIVFGFDLSNISFHNCRGIISLGNDYFLGGGYCQFRDLVYTNDIDYALGLGTYDNIAIKLINCQHCWIERITTRNVDRIGLQRNIISNDPCSPHPNACQPGIMNWIDCYGSPYSTRAKDGCIKIESNNVIVGWNIYAGQTLAQAYIIRPQINNAGDAVGTAQVSFIGHRNKLYTATSTAALTVGDTATQASSGATATVLASDTSHLLLEWKSGTISSTVTYAWTDQHSHTFTPTGATPTGSSWTTAWVGASVAVDGLGEGGYYGYLLHGTYDMQIKPAYCGSPAANADIRCEWVASAFLYGVDPGTMNVSIDSKSSSPLIHAQGCFGNTSIGDYRPAGFYYDVSNGGIQFSFGYNSVFAWNSDGMLYPNHSSIGQYSSKLNYSDAAYLVYGNIIYVDASSAPRTITLRTDYVGQVLTVKKIDSSANAVTVDAGSGNTIDGNQTYTLTSQYSAVTIQHYSGTRATGCVWYVINKY